MMDFYNYINKKLKSLKDHHLLRELTVQEKSEYPYHIVNNKKCIDFSSNDYLGLSHHPQVINKAVEAIKEYGTGATASRLISGTKPYHIELENKLALFKRKEKALLFGSGYLANLALLSTLCTNNDLILCDELNHASIMDGTKIARAETTYYPHQDFDWIRNYLHENRRNFNNIFIVSDSVFSMDGDILNLKEFKNLSDEFNLIPIVDEAHSTGVIGICGQGIESHFDLQMDNLIIMGTLGKALGTYGAFVCAKDEVIQYIINKARPFIYSTALPPAPVISAAASLDLLTDDDSLHESLRENIQTMNKGMLEIGQAESQTAIFPIVVGKAEKAMELSNYLFDKGFFVQGIRPPTVPHGKSRIRITISAIHSTDSINELIKTLKSYDLN